MNMINKIYKTVKKIVSYKNLQFFLVRKRKKFDWLLKGLVYCKECGSQMILKVEYTDLGTINSIVNIKS